MIVSDVTNNTLLQYSHREDTTKQEVTNTKSIVSLITLLLRWWWLSKKQKGPLGGNFRTFSNVHPTSCLTGTTSPGLRTKSVFQRKWQLLMCTVLYIQQQDVAAVWAHAFKRHCWAQTNAQRTAHSPTTLLFLVYTHEEGKRSHIFRACLTELAVRHGSYPTPQARGGRRSSLHLMETSATHPSTRTCMNFYSSNVFNSMK